MAPDNPDARPENANRHRKSGENVDNAGSPCEGRAGFGVDDGSCVEPGSDELSVDTDGAFPEAAENFIEGAVRNLLCHISSRVINQVLSLVSNEFRALMAFLSEIRAHSFDARVIVN